MAWYPEEGTQNSEHVFHKEEIFFCLILCHTLFGLLVTDYHRLAGLNNSILFLTSLNFGKPEIRVPSWFCSGEVPLFGLQIVVFLLCPYMAGRDSLSLSLLRRILIPFRRSSPLGPDYLPNSKYHHVEDQDFNIRIFRGQKLQSIVVSIVVPLFSQCLLGIW